MPDALSSGEIFIALTAAAFFAASVGLSVARRQRAAIGLWVGGIGITLSALIYHAVSRGNWLPLEDNFDALLWLALIIACVALYLQRSKTVGRLDWVAGPITVLLIIGAAAFGAARPHSYTDTLWAWTHRISVYTSPVAFAVAASAGGMYLLLTKRLRNKHSPIDASFGSLERLERVSYAAVTIGFALLSVGLITGVARVLRHETELGTYWFWQPKVLLATAAFVIYALVLHSPLALRGRGAAILSIAGFVLLLGTIAVVQVMH
ncbi:MAG TPA: cytochrome c biogenesis protein CcsA [Tepidisphaeraceae bacterium]|jgi:ABC-type transport system involved in cytochrome c biogenesis permease subunit